jgi:cation/acetate symporter
MIPVLAVVAVTVTAVVIGAYGLRIGRTTSDFLVAARSVSPGWNAAAISGEYLSAASFLGIAGLIMKDGLGMLWYPTGYTAGYLLLLLFVAAPLRRFGAYTIPDFAEGRLDSSFLRRVATVLVLFIGWFYLLPQLKGAGITLQDLVGAPYWVGVVIVGTVVTANIAFGGMKGVTLVQAVQYWIKLTALALPALVLLIHVHADHLGVLDSRVPPAFTKATVVHFDTGVRIVVTRPVVVAGTGNIDGVALHGSRLLTDGTHAIGGGAELDFPAGATVPHMTGLDAINGPSWSRPFGEPGSAHPLFFTYSLIMATFLGTMGLPHILVRFYTNPDGRAARRTTVIVLGLIGVFYLFPAVFGALGRLADPQLYMTGQTDSVVLLLPSRLISGIGGQLLTALVAAGAFAAFLSTASGLMISVSGGLSHDLLRGSVASFRQSAVVVGLVAVPLALRVVDVDINLLVSWAFAIAASSFCPLLVLGIWWRGLTSLGAAAGLIVGGGTSSAAVLLSVSGYAPAGWPGEILAQPAAVTVPLAFFTMILLSRLSPDLVPADVSSKMLAMHTPEALGLSRNYRD